jgi:hypothetical protein
MVRLKAIVLSSLVASMCAACVVPAQQRVVYVSPSPTTQTSAQSCRDFKTIITVDGKQQEATGQACQQPDGTWKVTGATPPGQPPQVVYLDEPPPPVYYYNGPYYGPNYYYGPSVGIGLGYYCCHRHYW